MANHRIWAPWRLRYVSNAGKQDDCVFCVKPDEGDDREALIVHRGERCYVILNLYPYTSGHLMVAPYQHTSNFQECPSEQLSEMLSLAQRCQFAIEQVYRPDGFNLGMNLGRCAGAGVEHHLHLHVVPRWIGDSNFMTIVGETRVLPEALETTFLKLKPFFV